MATDTAGPATVKETLTSLTIAFAMALVFRAFVIEAFIIPTGSLAPTLLGTHARFHSDRNGYTWTMNPDGDDKRQSVPTNTLDPMTKLPVTDRNARLAAGDRILVHKYVYLVSEPKRFECVVFKGTDEPESAVIKRLWGLPGEQLTIVDGDVYIRPGDSDDAGANPWASDAWQIARKPERVQRAVWQPIYNSDFAPTSTNSPWASPWTGDGTGWDVDGRSYSYKGSGDTVLRWDTTKRSITDSNAYNPNFGREREFPVADLRLRAALVPEADGVTASAIVGARGHEFRADFTRGQVSLHMRVEEGEWQEVASESVPGLMQAGKPSPVEFWHVDQSMQVYAHDRLVLSYEYNWIPKERLENSTTLTLDQVMSIPIGPDGTPRGQPLSAVYNYKQPRVSWRFSGGSFTMHRVGLDRDLYYQSLAYNGLDGKPYLGTHPMNIAKMGPDDFMMLGDNSPLSLDSRAWTVMDPYVKELDTPVGFVNRDLILGKAFFVYFPAPLRRDVFGMAKLPIPDFGRMRFIR